MVPVKIIRVDKGFHVDGGQQLFGKFKSLKHCMKVCAVTPTCLSGDYNPWLHKCYQHSNFTACNTLRSHPKFVHFSKVPCCEQRCFDFWGWPLQVTVRLTLRDHCPVCPVCNVGVSWPNSWMDQDATWDGGRPWPRRHCVIWRPSSPTESDTAAPTFQAMSIVVKRSPMSATAEPLYNRPPW